MSLTPAKIPKRLILKRYLTPRGQHGAGVFELFLLATVAICLLQVAMFMYQGYLLDRALENTARFANLGETLGDLDYINSIRFKLVDLAEREGIDVPPEQIFICPYEEPNCPTDSLGEPGGYVRIAARYSQSFLSLFPFTFSKHVAIPYPELQQGKTETTESAENADDTSQADA